MSQLFLRKSLMAAAIASAVAVISLPAQAYEFQLDNPDWTANLDTTLSAGALWRVESQDPDLAANGAYNTIKYPSQIDRNDSDNNFDPGLASLVYKITPTLKVNWKDTYGAIVSGTYFYDQRIMDGTRDGGYDVCPGTSGTGCPNYPDNYSGDGFSPATKRYAGHYGRMLDTYVWGNFNLGPMPLTVKAGRQVINWGEALFITGGVNQANYYDLNALMLPGSKIREALLPLDALYFSLGLTQNLSAEAFYQFDWKPNFDAPAGSFWATNDSFPGHGADNVIIDGDAAGASGAFAAYNTALGRVAGSNYHLQQDQVSLKRGDDEAPKDSGQFGFALKYLAEDLNYTNFSFYFTNTHAKIPVVGATIGKGNLANASTICGGDAACIGGVNTAALLDSTKYFLVYPEDIQTYGFSFNTSIGKLALSGEVSYEPTRYIINEYPDNLVYGIAHAATPLGNGSAGTTANITDHCVRTEMGGDCIPGGLVGAGQTYYLYDTVQSYVGSLVGIYTFGPGLGADNLIGVLEAGMEHLEGLNPDLHYASTASVMQVAGSTEADEGSTLNPNHPWETYLDPTSWGYRAVFAAEYNNLIPQVAFTPSLRFSHDVRGNSAVGGNFMEGRRAATLSLDFLVANKFDVELSGTSFWGADYSNKLGDRDNASLAVSYSF